MKEIHVFSVAFILIVSRITNQDVTARHYEKPKGNESAGHPRGIMFMISREHFSAKS
jgi:hypothetical protein